MTTKIASTTAAITLTGAPAGSVICEGGSLALLLVSSVYGKDVGLTIEKAVGCIIDMVLVAVIDGIAVLPTCGLSCMESSKSLQEVSTAFFMHMSGVARRLLASGVSSAAVVKERERIIKFFGNLAK